jgi:hypothetical protein
MKKIQAAIVIALAVIITAGCAPTPSASPSASAPVESPTASSPTPTPTPSETAAAEPAEETPVSSFTANDVYELCKTQTVPYVEFEGVSPASLVYTPLSGSRVEQIDGIWHAMIGISGTPSDPVHVFCSVSGTLAAPNWLGYGAGLGAADDAAWATLLAGVG